MACPSSVINGVTVSQSKHTHEVCPVLNEPRMMEWPVRLLSDCLHFWLIHGPVLADRRSGGVKITYRPRCSGHHARRMRIERAHEHWQTAYRGVRGTVSEMSVTSKVISLDRVSICEEHLCSALFSAVSRLAVYEQVHEPGERFTCALKRFGQLKPLDGVKLMPEAKISTNLDATDWDS